MAILLSAPSEAMKDLDELDLFFEVWKQAIGPSSVSQSANGTSSWLHDFGTQTKWLTGAGWTWWLERFHPPRGIDFTEAQNFISLIIGMLGDRTNPQGEAVRFARQLVSYLENESS